VRTEDGGEALKLVLNPQCGLCRDPTVNAVSASIKLAGRAGR
jgi:hypothetical protein